MSVERTIYGIYGYDLTDIKDQILTERFADTKLYDELMCYKRKGKVQLFDDPMSGNYLYLGYVLGEITDDYDEQLFEISEDELSKSHSSVAQVYDELVEGAAIRHSRPSEKVMVFTEYY